MTKIPCNICGKKFATLGSYGDEINPTTGQRWWLCLQCFEKADALAALENRWPDARDFRHLKTKLHGN